MAEFTNEVNSAQDALKELNERMEQYISTLERANDLSLDFAKKKDGFGSTFNNADKLANQFVEEIESVKGLYDELNNQTENITTNMVNQFSSAFDKIIADQKFKLTNALNMNDLSIKIKQYDDNKKIINDILKDLLPKNVSMADTDIYNHLINNNGLGVFGLKKVELKDNPKKDENIDKENEQTKKEIKLLEEVNEGLEYKGQLYKIDKSLDMDKIHLNTLKEMISALKEYKKLEEEVGSTSAINKMAATRLLQKDSKQVDKIKTNNKIANADSDTVIDSITVGRVDGVKLEQVALPNNMEESLYERSSNERLRGFTDEKGEHKGYEQIVENQNKVVDKLLEVLQTAGYVTQNISDATSIVSSANFDGVIRAIVALNTNKDLNEVTDQDIMEPKNRIMSLEKLENANLADSVLELLQSRSQNEESMLKDFVIGDMKSVDLSSGSEEELAEKSKELVDKVKDASYDMIQRTVDSVDKYEKTEASQYDLKTLTATNKIRAQKPQFNEVTGEWVSTVELAQEATTQMSQIITAKEELKNLIAGFKDAVKRGDLDYINGTGSFANTGGTITDQIFDAVNNYTQKAYSILGGRFADALSNMDKTGISSDTKYLFNEDLFNQSITELNKQLNDVIESQEYTDLVQSFENLESGTIKALADKNNIKAEELKRGALTKETKDFYKEFLFSKNQEEVNQQRQKVVDSGVLGEKDTQAQIDRLDQLNAQLEGTEDRLQNIRESISENGGDVELVEQKAERLNEIYQEIRSNLDNSYYSADNFIRGLNNAITNGGVSLETVKNYLNSINSQLDPDTVLDYAKTLKGLGAFDVFNYGNYERSLLDNVKNTKGLKGSDLDVIQYNNRVWETLYREVISNGYTSSGIEGLKNTDEMKEEINKLYESISNTKNSISQIADSEYGQKHIVEMANLNSSIHGVTKQYDNLQEFLQNNDSAGAIKYAYDKAIDLGDTLNIINAKVTQAGNKQAEDIRNKQEQERIKLEKEYKNSRRKIIDNYLNYQYDQKKYYGKEISDLEQLQKTKLAMREAEKSFGKESNEYDKAYRANEKLRGILKGIDSGDPKAVAAAKRAIKLKDSAYDYCREMIKNSRPPKKSELSYEEKKKEDERFAKELDKKLNRILGNKEMQFNKKAVFDFSGLSDSDLRNKYAEIQKHINEVGVANKEESKLLIALSTELSQREHLRNIERELNILTERRIALETKGNNKRGLNREDKKELENIKEREERLNGEITASKNIVARKHIEAVAAQAAAEEERKAKEAAAEAEKKVKEEAAKEALRIEKENAEKAAAAYQEYLNQIKQAQEEYIRGKKTEGLLQGIDTLKNKEDRTAEEDEWLSIAQDEVNKRAQIAKQKQDIEAETAAHIKKLQDELKNKIHEVVYTVKNAVNTIINVVKKANDILNKSFKLLVETFNTIENSIKRIIKLFGNFGNSLGKFLKDNNKSTNLLKGSWTELKSAIDLVSGAFNKIINNDLVKESKKLIGSINYLSVVIGSDLTASTVEWAEEMENVLGMDAAQLISQLAQVESELYALGMRAKDINNAGKGIVTEANVLTAITGIDTDKAISKLNMGLRGMNRSLAELGIYMSANEINRYLKDLQAQGGEYSKISTNINDLTEAQKSYVRYYVAMDKLMKAYTPERYAKSLETLTGRLYILNNQLAIMKQNLANFFGALLNSALMPIIGAILKLNEFINRILSKIASILHLDWKPIENSMAKTGEEGSNGADGLNDMSDALDDVSESADKAKGSLDSLDHVSSMSNSNNKGSDFDYGKLLDLVDMEDYYAELNKLNSDFLERCKKAWEDLIKGLKDRFTNWIENITGRKIDWDYILGNYKEAWENIKQTGKNIWQTIKNIVDIIVSLLWSIGDDLNFSLLFNKFTKLLERITYFTSVVTDKIKKPLLDMYNKYLSPYVVRFGKWLSDQLDKIIGKFDDWIAWWEDPSNESAINNWFDNLGRHIKAIIMIIEALFQGSDRKMHLDEVDILDGEGMEGFKKAYNIAGKVHDGINGLIFAFKELFGIEHNLDDVDRKSKAPKTIQIIIGLCTTLHDILSEIWDIIKGVFKEVFDFNGNGGLDWGDLQIALQYIKDKLDKIKEWFEDNKETIIGLLSEAAKTIGKIGEVKFELLMSLLEFITDHADLISTVLQNVQNILDYVAKNPVKSFMIAIGIMLGGKLLKGVLTGLWWRWILGLGKGGALSGALSTMATMIGGALNGAFTIAQTTLSAITKAVKVAVVNGVELANTALAAVNWAKVAWIGAIAAAITALLVGTVEMLKTAFEDEWGKGGIKYDNTWDPETLGNDDLQKQADAYMKVIKQTYGHDIPKSAIDAALETARTSLEESNKYTQEQIDRMIAIIEEDMYESVDHPIRNLFNGGYDNLVNDTKIIDDSVNQLGNTIEQTSEKTKTSLDDLIGTSANTSNSVKGSIDQVGSSVGTLDEVLASMDEKSGFAFDSVESNSKDMASGIQQATGNMQVSIKTNQDQIDKFKESIADIQQTFTDLFTQMGNDAESGSTNVATAMTSLRDNCFGTSTELINIFASITKTVRDSCSASILYINQMISSINAAIMSANSIGNIARNGSGSGYSTNYVRTFGFANGGVPSSGSLFFANENGNTELVGNFGGYSGVANQDMIIKAMQGAMVQAIRSAGGFNSNQKGNITINVGNWLGDEAGIRKLANKINSVNVKSNSNIANVSFSMS